MNRTIIHFRQDDFFIFLSRMRDPSLRGKPVIVGHPGGRGRVLAASGEAASEGVKPGMMLWRAGRMCPAAVVVPVDMRFFGKVSMDMFRLLSGLSPLVERFGPGGVFIDYTGCEKVVGPPERVSVRVMEDLKRKLGLSPVAGMGTNKLVSSVASRNAASVGDKRLMVVARGSERDFLAPFPLSFLHGLPGGIVGDLAELGVTAIGDLLPFSEELLVGAFGEKYGGRLFRYCRGIDPSPVKPFTGRAPRSFYWRVFFNPDTVNAGFMEAALFALVEKMGRSLRKNGEGTGKIGLRAYYSDAVKAVKWGRILPVSGLDNVIFPVALKLLGKLASRRVRIQGLELAASAVTPSGRQGILFDEDYAAVDGRLFAAMDRVRKKFRGKRVLFFGRAAQYGEY